MGGDDALEGIKCDLQKHSTCGLCAYKLKISEKYTRTVLPSVGPNFKNIMISIIGLAFLMVTEIFYK